MAGKGAMNDEEQKCAEYATYNRKLHETGMGDYLQ